MHHSEVECVRTATISSLNLGETLTKSVKTRHNVPFRSAKRVLVEVVFREAVHAGRPVAVYGRCRPNCDFNCARKGLDIRW